MEHNLCLIRDTANKKALRDESDPDNEKTQQQCPENPPG